MKTNPTTMSWNAPTTNIDGTEINYELEYEVGLENSEGSLEPLLTMPSQLSEDGAYEAPLELLGLDYGEHTVAMRTFEKDNPSRVSAWSNTVTYRTESTENPEAPLNFSVS